MNCIRALPRIALLAVLVSGGAGAQSTWNVASGNWQLAGNWNPSGIPASGSDVTFNGPATCNLASTGVTVGTLKTGGTGTVTITQVNAAMTIGTGISQLGATLTIAPKVNISGSSEPWNFASGTSTMTGGTGAGGGFVKTGSGTLSMTNANGRFVSVTITGGTLQSTVTGALGGGNALLNGGTLGLNSGGSITCALQATATANSTIAVQGGAHTLDFLDVGGHTVSVTRSGTSTLGIVSTLQGNGTIAGSIIVQDNTNFSPGNGFGVGTLNITGLTLAGTPNLNYTFSPSTALVSVTGALTVNGKLNIIDNGLTQGTYVLMQSTGTMTAGNVAFGTGLDTTTFSYGLAVTGNQLVLTVGPAPTAVGMASKDVVSNGHASYITWQTGFESKNLGFHVYRQDGALRTLLSPGLIAGSGLRATGDLKTGRNYAWQDSASPAGGTYWIESIDMKGTPELFGPVTSHPGKSPSGPSSQLFSDFSRAASVPGQPSFHVRTGDFPAVTPSLAQQWVNASGLAAKLLVREAGVYRVPSEQLFASGIPTGVEVSALRLWTSGAPVSFRIISADGVHLQPGDAIEFYGHGIDTRYSDTRVYWLTLGSGVQQVLRSDAPFASSEAGESFIETLVIQQELYHFSGVQNGSASKFFGPQVPSMGLTRIFSTPALDVHSSSPGILEVAVQGLTTGPHTINVTVNGVAVGSLAGTNSTLMTKTFTLPLGLLVAGDNSVVLASVSATDVDVEVSQQLSYPRLYLNTGTALQFTAPGGSTVRLQAFPATGTRVFDISNPEVPVELALLPDPSSTSNATVNVPFAGDTHTLYAFNAAEELAPLGTQADVASQWNAYAGADFVILGHASLLSALPPLVQQREREGLKVATVDVQDVYDEFSYGQKDAAAITAFLQYAAQHWATPPKSVLIVGGATFDPRDYLNNPGMDLVPTNFVETAYLETASDGAFVDFPNSKAETMAVGRWPVVALADATLLVSKTLGRAAVTPTSSLLLVRDRDDATSFSSAEAQVRASVAAWPVQQIARGSATDANVHTAVVNAIRTNPAVMDYQGHGAEDFEDGYILEATDSDALANAGQSIVFSAPTCFNGYFIDIGRTSLVQALLTVPGGGAWAAWASSGETSPVEHPQISSTLLEGVVAEGLTLGEASVKARSAILDPDVRSTFHLFGDPSARMAPAKSGGYSAPTGVQTHGATGCGTPGGAAPAVLPLVALALMLASLRARRTAVVRARPRKQ